ncbi:outer membrane protein assembly factor BamE [Methylomonas sp. SURF-2]|uniref:Outer membrane protein assembly factor BamE n=1 Tax=Methylomonas subterranea TaxID=2952225 RepID=A0ABT1TIY0_9GAMM|nr:outer membrane protein assembly factor BamE [Methylomonas sp. SURF-2]MCQ8105419.1 outer membrane protein assembly factor BamE [Methylomonas sp. SURF-2]
MHRRTLFLAVFGLSILLTGCKKELKPDQLAPGVQTGQVYYTQFSLFQEKNNFRTTNYRKGILIPINTPVTLQAINSGQADLRLVESGQPLSIENVSKHTQEDMQTAFKKIAAPAKVDLSQFSAAEQEAILAGQVKKGMSRKAVLAAIGYPPLTETPTLNSNDWVYWKHRFDRFVVHFKNDKVDNIVD